MCEALKKIKIEADFSADPLWCAECFMNLECKDFALSEALTKALFEWVGKYGTWIDWETDGVVTGGVEQEAAHNARGAELMEQVKKELTQYEVVFSPSTYAKRNREV